MASDAWPLGDYEFSTDMGVSGLQSGALGSYQGWINLLLCPKPLNQCAFIAVLSFPHVFCQFDKLHINDMDM